MGVYHLLAQSFPIVLWNTAFLFSVIRVFSDRSLPQRLGNTVTALCFLGVLAGAVTYALGFLVWPLDASISSPLVRDHIMLATWSLAFWTVVLVFAWRLGEAKWHGANRWIMLGLTTFGVMLVNIAGTLGGSVAHNPSAVSDVVRYLLSWQIYTTHYVPDITLWLLFGAAVLLVALGVRGRTRRA